MPDEPILPPVDSNLSGLAEAVKASGGAPVSDETITMPPQVSPPPQLPPEEPSLKKKSKKGVVVGILLFLLLVIPLTAYYVISNGVLGDFRGFAYLISTPEQRAALIKSVAEKAAQDKQKIPAVTTIASGPPGSIPVSDSFQNALPGFEVFGTYSPLTNDACPHGCTDAPPTGLWKFATMDECVSAGGKGPSGTYQCDGKNGSFVSFVVSGGKKVSQSDGQRTTPREPPRIITVTSTPMPTTPPTSTPTPTTVVTVTVTVTPTDIPTSTPTGSPTATSIPTPGNPYCDASCGVDGDCPSGLMCSTVQAGIKRCRNSACVSYSNCTCPSTPTPTTVAGTPRPTVVAQAQIPKTPVAGGPSVLGASTIGGGILLLLIGLLL